MSGLLVASILLISTAPLYAQRQQQDVAKLKADARNLVGIIGSDKTKTQTYCQIHNLSEQLIQAVQKKDRKKANALAEKIAELSRKMGSEFTALIDIEKKRWVFEIKWDGFRLITKKRGHTVRLWSRNGIDVTTRYAVLVPALQRIDSSCVIDGELCALDAHANGTSVDKGMTRSPTRIMDRSPV